MLKEYGIQCNKSTLHSINVFNHHSIAYEHKTFSCTNDIIAKDDGSNRLIRLVPKLGLVVTV
jgi:hypothetical protein